MMNIVARVFSTSDKNVVGDNFGVMGVPANPYLQDPHRRLLACVILLCPRP